MAWAAVSRQQQLRMVPRRLFLSARRRPRHPASVANRSTLLVARLCLAREALCTAETR